MQSSWPLVPPLVITRRRLNCIASQLLEGSRGPRAPDGSVGTSGAHRAGGPSSRWCSLDCPTSRGCDSKIGIQKELSPRLEHPSGGTLVFPQGSGREKPTSGEAAGEWAVGRRLGVGRLLLGGGVHEGLEVGVGPLEEGGGGVVLQDAPVPEHQHLVVVRATAAGMTVTADHGGK